MYKKDLINNPPKFRRCKNNNVYDFGLFIEELDNCRISFIYRNLIHHFGTKMLWIDDNDLSSMKYNIYNMLNHIKNEIIFKLIFHKYDENKVRMDIINNIETIFEKYIHKKNNEHSSSKYIRKNEDEEYDEEHDEDEDIEEYHEDMCNLNNKLHFGLPLYYGNSQIICDEFKKKENIILINLNDFTISLYFKEYVNRRNRILVCKTYLFWHHILMFKLQQNYDDTYFYKYQYEVMTSIRNELAQHPLRLVSD